LVDLIAGAADVGCFLLEVFFEWTFARIGANAHKED
jgi:hypothetical protein